jgi:hypothetical protein
MSSVNTSEVLPYTLVRWRPCPKSDWTYKEFPTLAEAVEYTMDIGQSMLKQNLKSEAQCLGAQMVMRWSPTAEDMNATPNAD